MLISALQLTYFVLYGINIYALIVLLFRPLQIFNSELLREVSFPNFIWNVHFISWQIQRRIHRLNLCVESLDKWPSLP